MRKISKWLMFIAVASLILVGCEPGAVSTEEGAQTASAKQAITTGAAVQSGRGNDPINPAAADPTSLKSRPSSTNEPSYQDTERHQQLVGMSTAFPWAGDRAGGWQGTGHPDPEPLKQFSNEEMLKMASNKSDKSDERQHALVSIGRRKMPGAIDALAAALTDHNEIYQVREMGLSGLIEHGGPEALKLMWQALKNDPSEGIRGMAIWGIALYGTAEAEAAVMHGLSDEHPNVKGMAVLAVWALKDKKDVALSILTDTAKVTERVIWQESLNVLSRMPHPEAASILYSIAKSETGDKQQSAVSYYRTWLRNYPDLAPR